MSKSRRKTALANAIDIIDGGTPKTTISEYWHGSIPWLSVSDFNSGYRWVTSAAKSITQLGVSESATTVLDKGDVIISARGTVGVVAQLGRPMAFNQSCYGIRGKKGIADTDFIYYLLHWIVPKLKQVAHGAVFDTITRETFKIVEVDLPPLPEQQAIARILGTLDNKIEINRRMNETLEAMTQALFKSWFIDFDPVRAKAEGRDPGLPDDVSAFFPDSLENSELGPVPCGWQVVPLRDVMEINPPRALRRGCPAPYVGMEDIPTRGHSPYAVCDRLFGSGVRFMNGDTLLARITPCLENGKTAYVDFLDDGQIGWGSTEYIVLRPKAPLPAEFGYCLARSEEFRDFAIRNMTGTSGRQRVVVAALAGFLIARPPDKVCKLFGRVVAPVFKRSGALASESRSLAVLRDSLLPRLLSGELRVGESERMAGVAP